MFHLYLKEVFLNLSNRVFYDIIQIQHLIIQLQSLNQLMT